MNISSVTNRADYYSDEKLQKFKEKHPVLTYKTYKLFREYGVQFNEIAKMYGMPKTRLRDFVNGHEAVMRGKTG